MPVSYALQALQKNPAVRPGAASMKVPIGFRVVYSGLIRLLLGFRAQGF